MRKTKHTYERLVKRALEEIQKLPKQDENEPEFLRLKAKANRFLRKYEAR